MEGIVGLQRNCVCSEVPEAVQNNRTAAGAYFHQEIYNVLFALSLEMLQFLPTFPSPLSCLQPPSFVEPLISCQSILFDAPESLSVA